MSYPEKIKTASAASAQGFLPILRSC